MDITGQIPGFTSIVWELNGQPFQQPPNSETVTTIGSGIYTVIVEYGNGCIATDTLNLTEIICTPNCDILPRLDARVEGCTVSVIEGSSVGSGTTIAGHLWDFGDGTTASGSMAVHSYSQPGTYILTYTVYAVDLNGNCCLSSIQTEVEITDPCPEECGVIPQFEVDQITNEVSLFSSTSYGNGVTTLVGYEWTINGTIASTNEFFC